MPENIRKKRGHWESFDDIDGLGHECGCLLEDREGNIWIVTSSGLSRYDGREFVTFTAKDGLASNDIRCISQDSEGNIWIGASSGLSRYDGREFVTLTNKDGLVSDDVRCISQDSEGNIWIGTSSGLSRYDGREFVNLTNKDGLAGNDVHCIYQDKEGNIWIGTWRGGLSRYDGKGFVNFNDKDGLAGNYVHCIHQDKEGNIWIGTHSGLSCYDGKRKGHESLFVNFTDKDGLASNHIWCIHEDREGNIWLGALGGGVSCYDGSEFVNFNTEDGLAHNDVFDIMQDREGSLWFACYHGGISRYNPYEISSISDESVREVMMQDREGKLWWGFRNILSRFDGKDIVHYPFEHEIFELFEDSKGQFWVGTDGGGVFRYNNSKDICSPSRAEDGKEQLPQNLTRDDGLVNNRVIRIYADAQGNIWIGTRGGLSRYDGKEFTNFTTDDGLRNNVVSVICQDKSGMLWFAGWAGGGITGGVYPEMKRRDGKSFRRYTKDDGLVDDRVISIIEDDKHNLWIGTPAGISYFDGQAFKNYTTADGLLGSFAQRIFQDSKGQIWIATLGGGVSRFDGLNFQSLTTEDGLPSNCVTGITEYSDGSMFISTYRGICQYVPDYRTRPLIRIDEVDADKIYQEPEAIKITESVPSIRIKFHGISFKTKRIRYSYILKGYDKDLPLSEAKGWKATWDEEVRYENLPPGEYTFKVIAINRDLVYSEKPAELRLTVIADTRDKVISELEEKVRERTKELKEAKDYIDNVIKSMADTLIVVNQEGIIRTVNQATLELLSYEENELLGKPIETILAETATKEELLEAAKINDLIERDFVLNLDEGFIKNVGNTYLSKDGREIPVLFSGSIMHDDNGEMQGIVCVAQDITGRKQMEEELRKHRDHLEELVRERTEELTQTVEQLQNEIAERKRAEELTRLQQQQLIQADKMATLGILSSGVAHEINNPNNFILLNAKIFQRVWNDVMPILEAYYEEHGDFAMAGMPYTQAHEKIGQLISGMSEGSQRIAKIVKGLKDFARQDTGDLEQAVDINTVIDAAILIVNNLIKKSTNHFACDYGGNLPEIRGNTQQLEQVIINLITNACQALQNRENGLVISTSYDSNSHNVIVKVRDEGIGISPECMKYIMDPFFTTKRSSGGTGLGLSISYSIVKAHGGNLDFTSALGKGTTVVLTLPVNQKVLGK
ncbi:PAS domain S-box protein [Candidatus Poribacteria bacterium]|nr:PAS domain S-box protein [Candidatus Poribacteria bacterium]